MFKRLKNAITYEDILLVLVLGGSDDAGGNHELLPGLGKVDVVSTFLVALVHVRRHLLRNVLGTNMDL